MKGLKKLGLVSLTILVGFIFKGSVAHAGDLDTVYDDGTVVEFSMPESNQGEESTPAFQGDNSGVGNLLHDLPAGITPAGVDQGISSYSVIGSDGRVRINNTTSYPYAGIVYVYSVYPNGKAGGGTGSMISKDTVLTAGHCIYSKENGGWAKSVTVYPGLNGNIMPYGSANSTSLMSVKGWTESSSSEHDIGAIKLNKSIGNSTGWFGLTAAVPSTATITGYPGDKPDFTMWSMSGAITKTTVNNLYYSIDTAGGQSGSGVYNSQAQIAAVHAYGYNGFGNSGTRITIEKFNLIKVWTGEKASVPTNAVKKMHGIRTNWFVWNGYEINDLRNFLAKYNLSYTEFKENGHIGVEVKWFNQNSVNKRKLTDYLESKNWHYEVLLEGANKPLPKFTPIAGELPFKVKKMHGVRTNWYLSNGTQLAELRSYLNTKGWSYTETSNDGYVSIDVKWFNQNSPSKRILTEYLEAKKWHYEVIIQP